MKIAYISAYIKREEKLRFHIDYLTVVGENETHFEVADHPNGTQPRSNTLSKEIDYEAADDGYASLNMPYYVNVDPMFRTSANIYVLEENIEKGKELLKNRLIKDVERKINELEKLKKIIKS